MLKKMIKCENLTKIYPLKNSRGYPALKNINVDVKRGEFVSICGPSGCGKSTLLNILGFLDIPTKGQYYFKGKNVSGFTDARRSLLRRREVGFVFQSFNLLPRLSALDNVKLPMLYNKTPNREAGEKAINLLRLFNLEKKARNSILELSGGERQRTAMARALANSPDLLLADEPTGNLDSVSSSEIMKELKKLNQKGMTIIMVTHDVNLASMTSRILEMKDGWLRE